MYFIFLTSQVLGTPRFCKNIQRPLNIDVSAETENKAEVKAEVKVDKKDEKKKDKGNKPDTKPEQKKKEEKPKVEAKPEPVAEDEDKPKKAKNELDTLPPTNFILDSFKKDFLNTKEKASILDKFFKEFDSQGWSLWFLHYDKTKSQGESLFKASNFKSIFLQVLILPYIFRI